MNAHVMLIGLLVPLIVVPLQAQLLNPNNGYALSSHYKRFCGKELVETLAYICGNKINSEEYNSYDCKFLQFHYKNLYLIFNIKEFLIYIFFIFYDISEISQDF